jgi:hypothetical protein
VALCVATSKMLQHTLHSFLVNGASNTCGVLLQIGITMTALEVLAFVAEKSGKDMTNWSLYELLCDGDLGMLSLLLLID